MIINFDRAHVHTHTHTHAHTQPLSLWLAASWPAVPHLSVLAGCFYRIKTNARLADQCSISPSVANIDIRTTVNSYFPIASWMSISGRLFISPSCVQTGFCLSCNSTIWPALETLIFFLVVFHVWSFLSFIGDQRLVCSVWIESIFDKCLELFLDNLTLFQKIFLYFAQYHAAFFTRLKRLLLCSVKGLKKFSIAVTNCSMSFSSQEIAEADKVCWWVPSFSGVVSAISLASKARRASSGAMRKTLALAFGFRVIPTSPPETFIERFTCSRAWSAPKAQNDTCRFLLTTQLPLQNSSYISGSGQWQHLHFSKVKWNPFDIFKTSMRKEVLCEQLEQRKMQPPVPCSDRSNELWSSPLSFTYNIGTPEILESGCFLPQRSSFSQFDLEILWTLPFLN